MLRVVRAFLASASLIVIAACARPPPPLPARPPAEAKMLAVIVPLVDFDVPWRSASPEETGLARRALEKLVLECERTGSEAVLVLSGERVVVARAFGHVPKPVDTKSVTKGFAGLAIGFLVADGKLTLDDPLSKWFPEWKEGQKSKVLLRHVLTHTSGLSHERAAGRLEAQKDRLAYVRALSLVTEPGATFSYNNEAAMLLSGVIAAAAGEPLDSLLGRRLFEPLGITDATWQRDGAGNITTNSGLSLTAVSLAKVGVALRDGRVVPASWIAAMQEPTNVAPWHGLMTWIVEDGPWQVQSAERRGILAKNGLTMEEKLAPLDGRRFRSRPAYWLEAGALLTTDERAELATKLRDDLSPTTEIKGIPIGFNWNGWLGQHVIVLPRAGVVAVRQRRQPPDADDDTNGKIGLLEFPRLVRSAMEP